MIMCYRSVYNQIASESEDTSNPVYKLRTVNLQVLINVLISSIFEQ